MSVRFFEIIHFVSPVTLKLSLVKKKWKNPFLYNSNSSLKVYWYVFIVEATAFELFTNPRHFTSKFSTPLTLIPHRRGFSIYKNLGIHELFPVSGFIWPSFTGLFISYSLSYPFLLWIRYFYPGGFILTEICDWDRWNQAGTLHATRTRTRHARTGRHAWRQCPTPAHVNACVQTYKTVLQAKIPLQNCYKVYKVIRTHAHVCTLCRRVALNLMVYYQFYLPKKGLWKKISCSIKWGL